MISCRQFNFKVEKNALHGKKLPAATVDCRLIWQRKNGTRKVDDDGLILTEEILNKEKTKFKNLDEFQTIDDNGIA